MMNLNLNDTPVKLIKNIAPPGLAGLDFIEKKKLITEMQKDEPKIIYDTMRPVGDEFWNHIDGIKTLKTIAENICFQFDLILNHEHFLKIAEGLYKSKYIDFK